MDQKHSSDEDEYVELPEMSKPRDDELKESKPEESVPKEDSANAEESISAEDQEEQLSPPPPANFDTLVVSGGSVKGLLALGALQCAEDMFLLKNVNTYIGTSCGAMICYLMAIGYSPLEIMIHICTEQAMDKIQEFNIVGMMEGRGAVSFHPIQDQLERMTMSKISDFLTLGDLQERFNKTLICVTYNATKRCAEYLGPDTHPKLPCLTALRMSANLPLVFQHYKYRGSLYVDGGISDNFAIQVGDEMGGKVLGLSIDPETDETAMPDPTSNMLEYVYKLLFVPIAQATQYKIAHASSKCRVLRLAYPTSNIFSFKVACSDKLQMYDCGYSLMHDEFAS